MNKRRIREIIFAAHFQGLFRGLREELPINLLIASLKFSLITLSENSMATDKTAYHNDKYYAIFPLHFLFNYFLYLLRFLFFQPYYGHPLILFLCKSLKVMFRLLTRVSKCTVVQ